MERKIEKIKDIIKIFDDQQPEDEKVYFSTERNIHPRGNHNFSTSKVKDPWEFENEVIQLPISHRLSSSKIDNEMNNINGLELRQYNSTELKAKDRATTDPVEAMNPKAPDIGEKGIHIFKGIVMK